ncbi:MAG: lysine--tRNA ligase, partial [Flavobacterium sp.]|nr:lysine--tRNA ligase [Flavobacterium sp.]
AEEKMIVELLQKNENTMELAELKTQAALSGKKWDKAMKTLAQHGLTKVAVNGESKVVELTM